ncbi:MAG: SDR family NAD(P)-dependent oxidoreductase [Gammaproteobacteria bacterium]|nr:SDR family NAD(P)-dependent oxidoreductase [Gammaproteobacteria bacterium]
MTYIADLFSLNGKTAVVVGGTGELCGAMALSLGRAGAEVLLVGRSKENVEAWLATICEAGGTGYFVAADVSSRSTTFPKAWRATSVLSHK